jgi:hypothetical protein
MHGDLVVGRDVASLDRSRAKHDPTIVALLAGMDRYDIGLVVSAHRGQVSPRAEPTRECLDGSEGGRVTHVGTLGRRHGPRVRLVRRLG